MQVIAERDKRLDKIVLFLGVAWTGLSVWLLSVSLWYIFALVLGVFFTGCGFYGVVFLPKTAIGREKNDLVFPYAFHQKRIDLSAIEYVSYNELGEFHRSEGGLFTVLYLFKNDVRQLTITVKEEDTLKHFRVGNVLDASAVATAINGMVEQAEKEKTK